MDAVIKGRGAREQAVGNATTPDFVAAQGLEDVGGLGPGFFHGGEEISGIQEAVGVSGVTLKVSHELRASPGEAVVNVVWEVVNGALGGSLLRRVVGGTVVLGQVWHHDLDIALPTKKKGDEVGSRKKK